MTKQDVMALWGGTGLISYRTVDGKATETWEYHFLNTDSVCWVTFSEDKVVSTQCQPLRGRRYSYYSGPGPTKAGTPPPVRSLVREGFFAMKLAEALKIEDAANEAAAESRLASVGIAPRQGWIADYPLTPDVIRELENAIGVAADSGKIAMNRDEAMRVFQELIADIESQSPTVEPSPGRQLGPEPNSNLYYPHSLPPYYGGYHRFYYPYPPYWR